MESSEADGYADLPDRIAEVVGRLQASSSQADVADDVDRLLSLVQDFHGVGLSRLVELIHAWRGEIFLDAVERHPVAGVLLGAYDLPGRG